MSQNVIQTSFASGEWSPTLYARVDLAKYRSAAALLRNFFVDYRSGASTRMGTKFVIQAFNSALPVRLIPFQTSVLVPYILEFGDHYVRPSSQGTPVLEAAFNITAITQANPCVVTAPGNNFVAGDWFFLSGINGMVQLSNRFFSVISVVGSNIQLADVNGTPINSLAFSPYVSGGIVQRCYKFASPYAAADLALLKFVEVANTMYLVHPAYPPTLLTFNGPTNWVFAPIVFGTTVTSPGMPTISASTSGTANYAYEVTAVDAQGQESIPSPPGIIGAAVNIGATAGSISASWAVVPGAFGYNVYKAEIVISAPVPSGAAFGFIGRATGTTFVDSNIVPDFSNTPPIVQNPFAGGNDPGTVCFFQQRLYYGGSNQFPQTFWGSQPGFYNNFNISDPIQADDSITGTLVSLQVNYIKAMVPMPGGLIILTAKGAWQLSAGSGIGSTTAVTPINATATPQAYNGISDVPPIIAVQDILYVQAKGSIVRDLTYNIYANIYTGADISIMSNHLFTNFQIVQWAWGEEPFKVVWAVRNDGTLLSLTYVKEQEIQGWGHSDTLGLFQSVATVTEGATDAIYVVVQRFIGGRFVKMIERMADRVFPFGAEDAWCVDCGIQSTLPAPSANLTITGTTPQADVNIVSSGTDSKVIATGRFVAVGTATFIADQPVFSTASVGRILRAGGGIATITQFITATQVVGTLTQPITSVLPNDPSAAPLPVLSGNWSIAQQFTTFFGLDYLTGQTVSILADGNVMPSQTVVAGSITLPQPASKVTVGLKYVCQLQTMKLDLGGEDTVQGKRKKINAITLRLAQARGLSFGHTFDALSPMKEFTQGLVLGQTIPLITGDERVPMDPLWEVEGQICLQQDNPLPATVLGIIPEITLGDQTK